MPDGYTHNLKIVMMQRGRKDIECSGSVGLKLLQVGGFILSFKRLYVTYN